MTNANLQRWNDHLSQALELTSAGTPLFDACRRLSIPWDVIVQLREDDPDRYVSLLRKPSQTQPDVQATPPARRKTNNEQRTRRPAGTVLRHNHLTKLGGMCEVDLRELIAWSPIPIPTPEPDGRDRDGMYWSVDRRGEWIAWFREYHNEMQARRPPQRRIPGV